MGSTGPAVTTSRSPTARRECRPKPSVHILRLPTARNYCTGPEVDLEVAAAISPESLRPNPQEIAAVGKLELARERDLKHAVGLPDVLNDFLVALL